jgi:hypothetical protein
LAWLRPLFRLKQLQKPPPLDSQSLAKLELNMNRTAVVSEPWSDPTQLFRGGRCRPARHGLGS